MACPDTNQLLELAEGLLGPADAEAIELHLDACPLCRRLLAAAVRSRREGGLAATSPAAWTGPAAGAATGLELSPDQLVDHFRVLRALGQGGMGRVYLARDTLLGRKVALKVIQQPAGLSPLEARTLHQRLLGEARATARFSHPNIVTIYEVGEHQGLPYLALELVEGETLQQRLQREGFSLPQALRVGLAIARALTEAHCHGILHRDLKPANVMLARDGRPRVLDFGLALIAEVGGAAAAAGAAPGDVCSADTAPDLDPGSQRGIRGTPAYMAPEQWTAGREVSGAADVWSLGIILHELLCGRRPYLESSLLAQRQAVCGKEPVPDLARQHSLPPEVARLVMDCLEKDPTRRPPASRVAERLLQLVGREEEPGGEENPFRGLFPFEESHARLFFGRDDEIAAVLERLRTQTVLPVIGPSGAGKSSFVQAGLIPRLREQGPLLLLQLRPGSDPFLALAAELLALRDHPSGHGSLTPFGVSTPTRLAAGGTPAGALPEPPEGLALKLREQPSLLTLWLMQIVEERRSSLLLFVDQLEELYSLVADAELRRRFMTAVCGAADDPALPVRVVFTLREEFLSRLADGPEARAALSHIQVLRSPDPAGLREVLMRPLSTLGYSFDDPALPDEMVADLRGETASLPLLQFAGQLLWTGRDRDRRLLLRARYQEVGGVGGALARHADSVLAGLSGTEEVAARQALLSLITPEGTRRTLTRPGLLERLPEGAGSVLDRLIGSRLLTEKSGGADGEPAVELAHESLIVTWTRLRRWIDESREDLLLLAQLEQAVERWQQRGSRDQDLLRGEELGQAQRIARSAPGTLPEAAMAFLHASERRQVRKLRRRRVAVLAAFALLTGLTLLFATKERETRQARDQAERGQAEALREGARSALARGELLEARARLRAALEMEDTGEARVLWGQLRRDPLVWRRQLSSFLYAVASSPSGEVLATAGADHAVYLVDTRTRGIRAILRGHADQIFALVFTPDGRQLISATWGGELWSWDLARRRARPLAPRAVPIWALAVSPDGRTLAAARDDQQAWLLDLQGQRSPRLLRGHRARLHGVAFSPDGKLLASASADGDVRLWEMPGGGSRRLAGHRRRVRDVAFSPDGRRLVSAAADGTVRLWEVSSGKPLRVLRGHTAPVYSALFTADGGMIASAGEDEVVRLWQADSGRELRTLPGHSGRIFRLALTAGGKQLASASGDSTLRLWDLRRLDRGKVPRGPGSIIDGVSFSPDGGTLATAVAQGVALWDVASGRRRAELRGHSGGVLSAEFSPDGQLLASASWDTTARLHELASGATRFVLRGHSAAVRRAVFSPDGQTLATASTDGKLLLWSIKGGERLRSFEGHSEPVMDARFSPDGKLLASASYDQTIRIWSLEDSRPPRDAAIQVLRGHQGAVNRLGFGSARELFSVGSDGTLRRWDLGSQSSQVLRREGGRLTGLALLAGGERLLYGGISGSVLVDRSGRELSRLMAQHLDVNEVALSPDGRLGASGGNDQTVRLFEVASGRPRWYTTLLLAGMGVVFTHRGAEVLPGTSRLPRAAGAWQEQVAAARLGAQHWPSGRVCLSTTSGALELREGPVGAPLARAVIDEEAADLQALPEGCLLLTRAGRVLLLRSGRDEMLTLATAGATALTADRSGVLVAVERKLLSFGLDGRPLNQSYPVDPGVTAILRSAGYLVIGYREGNIERRSLRGGPTLTFEAVTSSAVVRMAEGPAGGLAAGFADGLLGIWGLSSGRHLDSARLHGAPLHLHWSQAGRLLASSELGDHLVWDQSGLSRSYCELLAEVWAEAPLLWKNGAALPAGPPSRHRCRGR